ncbi:MAG TPA: SCO family protein [Rhizomicrobium sp.]|nr:SCO family protein [Rhizomicrobium sp.]
MDVWSRVRRRTPPCYAARMGRAGIAILFILLAACAPPRGPVTDIRGAMPPLEFAMTRANDGKAVEAQDYRGHAVILYFGYTNCPDACPTTLSDLTTVLQRLGPRARDVRVLFVTVDPDRDTPAALKAYVNAFAPEIDGLRGSADAVARLARRYRVTYQVTPASPGHAYDVMHSDSVFFFDPSGQARYVATSVANAAVITQHVKSLLD